MHSIVNSFPKKNQGDYVNGTESVVQATKLGVLIFSWMSAQNPSGICLSKVVLIKNCTEYEKGENCIFSKMHSHSRNGKI